MHVPTRVQNKLERWPKPLRGAQKIRSESQALDIELFTQLEFDFALIVTVPWFFPLEIYIYLVFLFTFVLQGPTIKKLGFF